VCRGLRMCSFVGRLFIISFFFFVFLQQIFHCSTVFLRLCNNGQRYAQYGVSKPLPYQDAERLKRATDAELRCNTRIAYDRMLPTGRSCYLSVYQYFLITFCCNFLCRCDGAGWAGRLFWHFGNEGKPCGNAKCA
jgi:hypothetical protein